MLLFLFGLSASSSSMIDSMALYWVYLKPVVLLGIGLPVAKVHF